MLNQSVSSSYAESEEDLQEAGSKAQLRGYSVGHALRPVRVHSLPFEQFADSCWFIGIDDCRDLRCLYTRP
jgi:hypothetical protein